MAILRILKDAGCGIETNSLNEIKKAVEIGFKGEDIVFNGVMKTREDLNPMSRRPRILVW